MVTRHDLARRRPEEARFAAPVRLLPGTPTLERHRSQRSITDRDFMIEAELGGHRPGDQGMPVTHGDPFGAMCATARNAESYAGPTAMASTTRPPPRARHR
ncbi:hypothetical protein ACQP1G_08670 [Nocardia sp. CA-107356]|uniref:hypothetical protein n=1 Tax=Nocardia sp. CA-107356 TaxID=3239972 RepID=UPI003D89BCFB